MAFTRDAGGDSGGRRGDDTGRGGYTNPNWWEGPAPAWWPSALPWPPALPPGAHYGQNPGSIEYDPAQAPSLDDEIAREREVYQTGIEGQDRATAGPIDPGGNNNNNGGGGGGGGTGTIGGLLTAPFTETFAPPTPRPMPGAPVLAKPDPFSYESFAAPTMAEAEADEGYQFGVAEGAKRLEASAAARGALNTGNTLRDLVDYGRSAARQQYGDVYGRRLGTYSTNRDTALNAYLTNYKTQFADPNDAAMHVYDTDSNTTQRSNELDWNHAFDQWVQDWKIFGDQRDSTFNKTYTVAAS